MKRPAQIANKLLEDDFDPKEFVMGQRVWLEPIPDAPIPDGGYSVWALPLSRCRRIGLMAMDDTGRWMAVPSTTNKSNMAVVNSKREAIEHLLKGTR